MFFSENLKKNQDIQHCFFSKKNGTSTGIYESLNCGIGSNDNQSNVQKNLEIVSKKFDIEKKNLILMNQTHSNKVKIIEEKNYMKKVECDAMITKNNSFALGVLTADCAPILIYEQSQQIIGCIHAGWRGAVNGIIDNTLKEIEKLGGNLKNLIVSIGPCIDQKNYEVKYDFYSKFIEKSKYHDLFFLKKDKETFYFDLRGFVNKKLGGLGISEIENVTIDTFASNNEYFSHRRAKKLGQDDYGRCISVIKKKNKKIN